ncbi:ABC transporter permease [Actinomadura barringtoniae]|uniref:ABC transporter permease n=1 Tax=Actinomadura barringtoniae TaxID=1427535 RepID=A0A939PI93_9ACTN|nr:ABC transporter permease [Actinomadura barringtoniae]MBO2453135.1 ABC transporter permease [Actinomadura barringtoniae]
MSALQRRSRSREATSPPGRRRPLTRAGIVVRGTIGLLVLFALLEALGRAGIVSRDSYPPASDVLVHAVKLLGDSEFQTHLKATVTAWLFGLALSILVAVPLGVLLGSVPIVNTATRAVVEFLRPIPSVAIIPLAGLILGSGLEMKATLIVYATTWPILFNTMYGLRDVDPVAKDTLRAYGFGEMQVLWRVSIPAASPFIYTGIRLAAAVALILTIGTEILSSFGEGIGTFMAQSNLNPDGVIDAMSGTLWTGVLGVLANLLLMVGDRKLFFWHHGREGRA